MDRILREGLTPIVAVDRETGYIAYDKTKISAEEALSYVITCYVEKKYAPVLPVITYLMEKYTIYFSGQDTKSLFEELYSRLVKLFLDHKEEIRHCQEIFATLCVVLTSQSEAKKDEVKREVVTPAENKKKPRTTVNRPIPSIASAPVADVSPYTPSLSTAVESLENHTFTCYTCNVKVGGDRVSSRCRKGCRLHFHSECWSTSSSCLKCESPLRKYSIYNNGAYAREILVQTQRAFPSAEPLVIEVVTPALKILKENVRQTPSKPYCGDSYRKEDVSDYEKLRVKPSTSTKARERKRAKNQAKLAKVISLGGAKEFAPSCSCPSSKLSPNAKEFIPCK